MQQFVVKKAEISQSLQIAEAHHHPMENYNVELLGGLASSHIQYIVCPGHSGGFWVRLCNQLHI